MRDSMRFTATARRLGILSAAATTILIVAYAVTLLVGLMSLESPQQPIGDPMFTISRS
jgi:Co/Zn/Cd efflux system component